MVGLILRVAALTAVYLLVLTSVDIGDVLVGVVVSTLVLLITHRRRGRQGRRSTSLPRRLRVVPRLVTGTLAEIARGWWLVVRFCVGRGRGATGIVPVPINPCSDGDAAAWGIRVGISPDSIVVDIDPDSGEMLVHVLDARTPDDVRDALHDSHRRHQRGLFT